MNKGGSSAAANQAKAEKEIMEEKKATAKTGAQKKPKKN